MIDTAGAVQVERPADRPGWLKISIERRTRTRTLWLADDEAAHLQAELAKQLHPVIITQRSA